MIPEVGQFITARLEDSDYTDTHLVTYLYMEGDNPGDKLLSCVGLGKSTDYPVFTDSVINVESAVTALSKFHGEVKRIWVTDAGQIFITQPSVPRGKPDTIDKNVFYLTMVERNLDNDFVRGESSTIGFPYQLLNLMAKKTRKVVCVATYPMDFKIFEALDNCDTRVFYPVYEEINNMEGKTPVNFISGHAADIRMTTGTEVLTLNNPIDIECKN